MRAKWLKFSILPSIKVRVGGQCIAPKTRTTLILDRYAQFNKTQQITKYETKSQNSHSIVTNNIDF